MSERPKRGDHDRASAKGGKDVRKKELRADFLLNFQRPPSNQRSPQAGFAPPPRRTRPSGRQHHVKAFAKGRFVQSSFRLFVENVTPDVVEAALNADAMLDWESVLRVDLYCEERPKCPICLDEDMVVPKITRCGHSFCTPCVMRYFMHRQEYDGRKWQRCPVCNTQVSTAELITVNFELVPAYREGDRASFVLASRASASTMVRPASRSTAEGSGAASSTGPEARGQVAPWQPPLHGEDGWHLSRVVRLPGGSGRSIFSQEIESLKAYRAAIAATGEDVELLPSIKAAIALLERLLGELGDVNAGLGDELQLPAAETGMSDDEARGDDEDVAGRDGESAGYPEDGGRSPALGSAASPSPASGPALAPRSPGPRSPAGAPGASAASSKGASPALGHAASPARLGGGSHTIVFYQMADGRPVFLQPFFTKLLLHEQGGNWSSLPASLPDIRLEQLQEDTVSDETRRRHKFLAHLPLGTPICFADVDLRNHLSRDTREAFAEEFAKRRALKKKEQQRTRKQEQWSKSRSKADEERYYQSLNLMHPTFAQAPPTAEDFAVPLPGRPAVEDVVDGGADGDADGAAPAASEDAGPTLADKLKGKLARAAPIKAAPGPAPPELGGGSFPTLGPARPTSSAGTSAWGKNCGSSLVKKDGTAAAEGAGTDARPDDGWSSPVDDQSTFGAALDAAMHRSAAEAEPADDGAGAGGAAGAAGEGGKKKKGRAAKATTIRLFG